MEDQAKFFKLSPEDARAFRRFGVEIPASIWPVKSLSAEPERSPHHNACISVVIKDLSIGGMSFVTGQAFAPNTALMAMLRLEGQSYPLDATVRRCIADRIARGKWLVGVQFLNSANSLSTIPVLIRHIRSLHDRSTPAR